MKLDFSYLLKFKKNFPNRKLFSLMDKIYDMKTLKEAWKTVQKNKGCAGIDKQTILEFKANKKVHLLELQRALKKGNYQPPPVLRRYIPKANGKIRPLGIPTVKDRVVQQAVKLVLEPVFENKFIDCSYGYRPERNCLQAMEQVKYWRATRNHYWVLDADISGFFDNVDHNLLISFVAKEISDGKLLTLIEKWLKAGVIEGNKLKETLIGTPQGGVISPLLANIYLHEFDKYMIGKRYKLIRYADDFVVMCSTKKRAEHALEDAKVILNKLKLQLHPDKTKIARHEKIQFLGFNFGGGKRGFVPRAEAILKFKARVKELTNRKRAIPVEDIVRSVNYVVSGWGNYYKFGRVKELFKMLDKYVRFRLRIFIDKKVSRYSHKRLSNYTLFAKYRLKSLYRLL